MATDPPIQHPLSQQSIVTRIWERWFNSIKDEINDAVSSASVWGSITGTLSDQTDLQSALDAKQDISGTINTYTSAETLTEANEVVLCDASSAAFTITLPSAGDYSGRQLVIKKINASNNDITIDGDASEEIDGSTTIILTGLNLPSVRLLSDGSNWWII